MWEEIALENGQISYFAWLLTLILDQVILHTVMHHSSTSTYIPNFIETEETFSGAVLGILLGRPVKGPSKFWVGQQEWCTWGRISFG